MSNGSENSETPSIAETEEVSYHYIRRDEEGRVIHETTALDQVSLSVTPGEFLAILGHNGSGKSTMAKHLNAILRPDAGTVIIDGLDTSREENILTVRRLAGMVFQNPDNQIIGQIVEEDVAFGPENLGIPTEQLRSRVDDALKKVGMWKRRLSSPNKLSGGQKQRVSIAGVLAMKPKILLLDEPTAMLDPHGRQEVLAAVHTLNREEGITVILITHDMEEAAGADRIFVMDRGQVALTGTPREVFGHKEQLEAIGLTLPFPTQIAGSLAALGIDLKKNAPVWPFLTEEELLEGIRNAAEEMHPDHGEESRIRGGGRKVSDHPARSGEEAPDASAGSAQRDPFTLTLERVSCVYDAKTPNPVRALSDIDLTIGTGEFIGLIGHTGSGKSTLVQHLNGLIRPTSGRVLANGEDIHGEHYNRKMLRARVGMVFQYPEHQLFETTVLADVCYGPKNIGKTQEEAEAAAKTAIALVGLDPDILSASPFELSGGQKRRVAIAGVLAMEPEILILDEPTAGLDPRGREEILSLIERFHKERGITILLVSHSMEDVARFATRLLVMHDGRLAMDSIPAEVFAREDELREMGLAVPETTRILRQLSGAGLPITDLAVYTPEETAQEIAQALAKKAPSADVVRNVTEVLHA